MNVLMPFWNLELMHRYFPQFKAISEFVDEFVIVYKQGKNEITPEYEDHFTFFKPDWRKFSKSGNKHYDMFLNTPLVTTQIRELVDIDRIDLIYSLSGIWFQHYSAYWREKFKIPYVMRLRGDDETTRKILGQGRIKRYFFRKVNDYGFMNADKIIPISKNLLDLAIDKRKGDSRVIKEVVPNGFDSELFKILPDVEKEYNFGYFGRVSKEKGSEFLYQLCSLFKNPQRKINFLICGDIEINSKFEGLDNVTLTGQVDYKEVPELMNKCKWIIQPSYSEGFPNTIFEAFLCGVPVLMSDRIAYDWLDYFGVKLKMNFSDWFDIMKTVKDQDHKMMFREMMREFVVQNFSWGKYSESMEQIFKEVI